MDDKFYDRLLAEALSIDDIMAVMAEVIRLREETSDLHAQLDAAGVGYQPEGVPLSLSRRVAMALRIIEEACDALDTDDSGALVEEIAMLAGRHIGAAAEAKRLRARVAELEAERWPIPGTEGDERYTAHALLGRVVSREADRTQVRLSKDVLWACMWSGVRGRLGLGSTYSQDLCRAYGYDPDTGAELATGSGGGR